MTTGAPEEGAGRGESSEVEARGAYFFSSLVSSIVVLLAALFETILTTRAFLWVHISVVVPAASVFVCLHLKESLPTLMSSSGRFSVFDSTFGASPFGASTCHGVVVSVPGITVSPIFISV